MTDFDTSNIVDFITDIPNKGFWYGLCFGVLVGIGYGYIRRGKSSPKLDDDVKEWLDSIDDISEWEQTIDNDPNGLGYYRLVLVVRTDLNMKRSKVAEHCSHAAVAAYQQTLKKDPRLLREWMKDGQPKLTLKVDSEKKLKELFSEADYYRFTVNVVHDVGVTQAATGAMTVLAIGPMTVLAIGPMDVYDYEFLVRDLKPY